MLEDYQLRIYDLNDKMEEKWGIFDLDKDKKDIAALENKSGEANFWNNRENAEKIMSQLKVLQIRVKKWEALHGQIVDLKDFYELAREEKDQAQEKEIEKLLDSLETQYSSLIIQEYLNDKYDSGDAFLTIHSGAGGTEANDWASMLLRMYLRWSERSEYKTEIIDILEAEGGIKSVTLQVSGEYAYGYLKVETGIHRLVRISPFDSNARRHTSFASVTASPVIDDTIEVDIKPEDLRIDTYRAGGAGGQHVNKTDSAVRITHYPTGIVVQCQNERSQFKNKSTAMKVLRSRVYAYYKDKHDEEKEKLQAEKKNIAWGNQIRSYVFQPYTMVKDHRTKFESGNIQAVMDGGIDSFIQTYLQFAYEKQKSGGKI
ncbi:MAG: peptide chain release factor 2 [Spirochaetales bacterium]|nr:peptide chain release factor 2 [Spirochaetales bacterium]